MAEFIVGDGGAAEVPDATRDERDMFELPVQDIQRALGLVRHHAEEWRIDPQRVGQLGFSAGANLAGHAAWDRGSRTYVQKPELDDPRGPDFLVFIYAAVFSTKLIRQSSVRDSASRLMRRQRSSWWLTMTKPTR